ncbi:MAG: glycosyltransferase family 4 protein [Bacteriovorax sp.]|jgi:glycosyltransferase involved in cell wall biosynthesis
MDTDDWFIIGFNCLKKIKIARVVTVPIAFVHIKAFLKFLKTKEVEVVLVSSEGSYRDVIKNETGLDIVPIEISREINLLKDLKSLWNLIKFFRQNKFDIIHSSTPKAGLLVAIAGIFSPDTIRIHTFTGQRWATVRGGFRRLLKFLDKLVIFLNKQCYADSPSQIEFLKMEGVAKGNQVQCLHKGSYGGIDCERFNNEKYPSAREQILSELKISTDSILVLFIGRVTRDKGVEELVKAHILARELNKDIHLIIVGPFEAELDSISSEILGIIQTDSSIHFLGFRPDPEKFFSGCNMFCLPSYREGFGTVVLEAAACGLPSIGTRIPGLVDSIAEGLTGLLVELKNIEELKKAILTLAADKGKRELLGKNAKVRARADFDSVYLANLQWQEYLRLLKKHS